MENERRNDRLLHALGLCAKARRLVVGTPMICEALRGKSKPYLVIAAGDNAANTQKKLADKCAFYRVPLVEIPMEGETLGNAVGKHTKVAAVAITDEQLCRLVEQTIEQD
ncbi:MAG: ribosomal L7Ae/L30e/S12e/Gadd45 family protein [Clostridia bacterium]|nr:ribosomal L7Ae/L30e/S12e/Gadd45 family protein [Clostridia bacterium]